MKLRVERHEWRASGGGPEGHRTRRRTRPFARNAQLATRNSQLRPAFTLVELMISLALALLLILGVNLVFRETSRTVGAGQTLSTMVRDNRAAQSILHNDFRNIVTADAPFLIIHNSSTPAFRNRADQQRHQAFFPNDPERNNPLIEKHEDGVTDINHDSFIYNHRNRRTDIVSFFARDFHRRQTADGATFVSPTSSFEAMIWYGHLRQPNNDNPLDPNNYRDPGILADNPHNQFSTDWILGRQAILLRNPVPDESRLAADTSLIALAPLAVASIARQPNNMPVNGPDGQPYRLFHSRFDLANTSIAQYRGAVLDRRTIEPDHWWQRLLYRGGSGWLAYPISPPIRPARFNANPYIIRTNSSVELSAQAALAAPLFMHGCTQFIIEYAGDFLEQDAATGQPTDVGADGNIDFVVYDAGTPQERREIRWYGLHRDITGDGNVNPAFDVVPLYILRTIAGASDPATFERDLQTTHSHTAATPYTYDCVWGPGDQLPAMIRITIVLEDPNDRLATPQRYEYVFDVQ